MASCSQCGLPFDSASRFCSRCGTLPQESRPFLYGGSILLGIALMVFAGIWWSLEPPLKNTEHVVAAIEAPDDVAVFITNCGTPDADKLERNINGLEFRSLLYRKARVIAVFGRSEGAGWKKYSIVDPKTLKPLTAERLGKRLPCSSGSAGPAAVHQQ
jgi:hypothetical protein